MENIIDKLDLLLVGEEDEKCPEGQKYWPIKKKCVPVGRQERKRQGNGKGMAESVVDAEDGVMDALEYGDMTKDEVFKLIKREYGLKRHEFNQAWSGLIDDGDIVKSSGNKWRRN